MSSCRRAWPFCALVLSLILATGAPSARAADEHAVTAPALAAIDAALARGEITPAEAILHRVQFVKASGALPKAFDLGGDRVKCGTPILLEAMEQMASLPVDIQEELKNLMVRPTCQTFIDTAHFRINYNTSGTAMVYGWPNTAYRDAVMAAAEHCWDFYFNQNDWNQVPGDGSAGGGSNLYDIYVIDVGSGIYGYTQAETAVPGGFPNDYTSFVSIDHAYDGFGYADRTLPMKVTVAHEFHHAVQMGYTIANNWWMEECATFMEDECYDSINDNYAYLSSFLTTPYKKISTFNGQREYGAFLWPTMLKEKYTHDTVRELYHCSATTNIFTCYDDVFGSLGGDFAGVLGEFGVWNFYTNQRNDGNHYVEGGSYLPYMSYDKVFSSYPTGDQHPTSSPDRRPEATGQSVMRFVRNAGSSDNLLTITLDGPNCLGQVCVVAKTAGETVFTEYYMNLDAAGNGTVDIPGWNTMEYAHMISFFPRECGNGVFDYLFSAETSSAQGVGNPALYTRTVRLDQNTPNPFGPETRISYRLEGASPVQLSVFDATGRQVRSLIQAQQAPGSYSVRWDGRNDRGNEVVPGVYFYRLQAGDTSEVRKMIVAE